MMDIPFAPQTVFNAASTPYGWPSSAESVQLDSSDYQNPPIISDYTKAQFSGTQMMSNPNVNHPASYGVGTATAFCNTAYMDGHVETKKLRLDNTPAFWLYTPFGDGTVPHWYR
jgi:prepilin-type processing-associated H-X9-DG protein